MFRYYDPNGVNASINKHYRSVMKSKYNEYFDFKIQMRYSFFTTLIHHFKRWINVNVRDEAHIYSLCYSRFLTQKFKVCTTFEMPNWPCHDDNREKEVVRFSSNPILFFRFWVARAIDERIEGFYMWWTFIVFFKLCVYKHTNSKNQFKTLLLIQ